MADGRGMWVYGLRGMMFDFDFVLFFFLGMGEQKVQVHLTR